MNRFNFWETIIFLSSAIPHLKIVWVALVSGENLPIGDDEYSRRIFRHERILVTTDLIQFSTTVICERVLAWLKGPYKYKHKLSAIKRRGLLELLLSDNLSRYPSAVVRTYTNWLHRTQDDIADLYVQVESAIEELLEIGFLREKPGGFLWMNLNVRVTLIEALKRRENATRGFSSRDEFDLKELLARSYAQLLLSSADPLAAFEALKHVFEGIRVAYGVESKVFDIAQASGKPKEGGNQVFSTGDIRLLISYGCTTFSTANRLLDSRLTEQFSDRVLSDLQREAIFCCRLVYKFERQDQGLRCLIVELLCRILRTRLVVFEMQGDYSRIESEICRILSNEGGNKGEGDRIDDLPVGRATEWSHFRKWVYLYRALAWQDLRHYEYAIEFFKKCLPRLSAGRSFNHREWQVLEMVVNCVESFGKSEIEPVGKLKQKLKALSSPTKAARKWLAASRIVILGNEGSNDEGRALQDALQFTITYSRRLVYLLIHVDHACEMQAHYRSSKTPEHENADFLDIAVWLIRFALGLIRGHITTDVTFTHFENTRFRAHLALIEGRIQSRRNSKYSFTQYIKYRGVIEASFNRIETQLADAESYVEEFPIDYDTLTRGVVELRRAEIKLQRAGLFPYFRELRTSLSTCIWELQSEVELPDPAKVSGRLKEISATLRASISTNVSTKLDHLDIVLPQTRVLLDCERSLRRAKRFLDQHPKSVWWWQVFLVLQFKLAEYMISLACLEVFAFGETRAHFNSLLGKSDDTVRGVVFQLSRLSEQDPFQIARAVESLGIYLWIRLVASAELSDSVASSERGNGFKPSAELIEAHRDLLRRLRTALNDYGKKSKRPVKTSMTFPQVANYANNILATFDLKREWYLCASE